MRVLFDLISAEFRKLCHHPQRLREGLRPRRWRQFLNIAVFQWKTGNRWLPLEQRAGLKRRAYRDYETYVRHQEAKLKYLDLSRYDADYRRHLCERLGRVAGLPRGASVLCLGARRGTEVKAFHDLGCFAVGVDLNPGGHNPYVLCGDFHQLQFAAGSVDVVFTNSADHAFDLERMIGEIQRVLKANGLLIVEAIKGEQEGAAPDAYASFAWSTIEDLIALFQQRQFHLMERAAFSYPWPGDQLCFRKE
jgi:SAM-dependent methyltransferase